MMASLFSKEKIDATRFMAEPVTDVDTLQNNANDMKTKMELLILRIQVSFRHTWLTWSRRRLARF